MNLRRRHLSESQRAMVAAKIANLRLGDNQHTVGSANLPTLPLDPPPSARAAMTQQQYDFRRQGVGFVAPAPVSQPDAARMLNVSERSVRAATAVRDHAVPELAKKVEAGQVSVSAAADVAKLAPVRKGMPAPPWRAWGGADPCRFRSTACQIQFRTVQNQRLSAGRPGARRSLSPPWGQWGAPRRGGIRVTP
jgi:hypothetical protein